MLYDAVERPGSKTVTEVRAAYEAQLRDVVEAAGTESVATESGVERSRLVTLAEGGSPDLTLTEAGAILATATDAPDAESVVREVRDHLLLGMTTGVLDVDTVASNVDLDLSPQEIQQAIEGRIDPTLAQVAAIHRFIAERNQQ